MVYEHLLDLLPIPRAAQTPIGDPDDPEWEDGDSDEDSDDDDDDDQELRSDQEPGSDSTYCEQ